MDTYYVMNENKTFGRFKDLDKAVKCLNEQKQRFMDYVKEYAGGRKSLIEYYENKANSIIIVKGGKSVAFRRILISEHFSKFGKMDYSQYKEIMGEIIAL